MSICVLKAVAQRITSLLLKTLLKLSSNYVSIDFIFILLWWRLCYRSYSDNRLTWMPVRNVDYLWCSLSFLQNKQMLLYCGRLLLRDLCQIEAAFSYSQPPRQGRGLPSFNMGGDDQCLTVKMSDNPSFCAGIKGSLTRDFPLQVFFINCLFKKASLHVGEDSHWSVSMNGDSHWSELYGCLEADKKSIWLRLLGGKQKLTTPPPKFISSLCRL